jgi:hypothetical protein
MAQPKMDQILRDAVLSQMRDAETAKSVTAALRLIEVLQDRVKGAPKNIGYPSGLSVQFPIPEAPD